MMMMMMMSVRVQCAWKDIVEKQIFFPVQEHKLMRQAVIWVILDHATPFSNDNNYVLKTSVGCARSLSLPRTLLSDQCLFLSPAPSLASSLTLCGWTHTSSVVDAGSCALWGRSAAPSEHSRPLHNHLTAVESKGSGCPDAGVDCSHLTSVCWWGASVYPQWGGWKSICSVFTPPYSAQKGGNLSLLTRVVFPVGWLATQQSPRECRKSDPKSPATNKNNGEESLEILPQTLSWDKEMSHF